MTIYQTLLDIRQNRGAGFFVLLDPDNEKPAVLAKRAGKCQQAGADALLIGGSFLLENSFSEAVAAVKRNCSIPVIIFPGGPGQLTGEADAVLFLSLISGRNPQHLIGDQVTAAPLVKRLGLEAIPTGYMLVSSGNSTTVEFISNSKPIPRDKPKLAAAHALAAQYLGMKLIYLEAGSGADNSVPENLITAVRSWVDIPLMVGGGIRSTQDAAQKVNAGADFIVVGTAIEENEDFSFLAGLCDAVHEAGTR
ncbi:geranylgeranylglyceryl/heptaprenylglyceryl phosphate synthase [candidate division LCP-89 bacterium B3_LCP]|uniref:Phosphoglycerol geranylgeranyltransferase n=1 Tax=candidate division LCP-89 bacterium B3_LCP TaxID=2012998 RepID=A0A532UQ68_UNCL8|nr:MAG: geranylgeranylglyceryl/heptaprenylglyceryl phosphate synthase [candidate division LCP-89 bacterium B3_LCP]